MLPALGVISLSLAVLAIMYLTPLPMLRPEVLQGVRPWCFIQAADRVRSDGDTRTDPTVPPIRNHPLCRSLPDDERAGNAPTERERSAAADGQGRAGASAQEPRTVAQVRALELDARVKFATSSAFLRAMAVVAALFAIVQLWMLWWSPRARRVDPSQPSGEVEVPRRERWSLAAIGLVLLATGPLLGLWEATHDVLRDSIVTDALLEAVRHGLAESDAPSVLNAALLWNFVSASAAAGCLLTYVAALSYASQHPLPDSDRLSALQLVLVIGALLFTAGVLTIKTGVGWAASTLDKASMRDVIQVQDRVADMWGFAASLFMLTAIGAAYFAIRGQQATAGAPNSGPALALRTPSGDDFKAFGWLVNILIALAPVWLSELLAKLPALLKGIGP